nr:diguanylate cyclase [Burkholderiales bacterium]
MQMIETTHSISDFSVRLSLRGIISEASASFLEYDHDLAGDAFTSLIHPDDVGKFERAMESALFLERKQSFVCRLLRKGLLPIWMDCHMIRIPETSPPEFALIAFDVSHWREDESKISYLATHDPLTDLPNRLLFNDRIAVSVASTQRHNQPGFALQLLDLDGFKKVNDTFGHVGGDELIKTVAGRLRTLVRDSDTIARIGGDEFAFILSGIKSEREAEIVAKKILAALHRPFRIDGKSLYISASIGTAIYPEHGKEPVSLFKHAEMAMYSAKDQGGNCWRLFDNLANQEKGDVSMESAMHEGIRNGEFLLHYQPIFCAATGKLRGAEALMRWDNPERGATSPAIFIPLAESSGLIDLLGRWVLRMACHQARQWQDNGFKDLYVSVNVSPRQFRQERLIDTIRGALEESGLDPAGLMLEIT